MAPAAPRPPVMPADFEGNCYEYGLYMHNWYRKRHGAPPLKLVESACDSANDYSARLARAGGGLMHSSGTGWGENLYGGPQAEAYLRHIYPKSAKDYMHKCAVREACIMWYEEVKVYNYNNPGFTMGTGHFTAMVWKAATEFGIGCWWVGGTIIVTGRYRVHPNMQGQFRANVLQYREVVEVDEEENKRKVEEENKRKVEEEAKVTEAKAAEELKRKEEEEAQRAQEEADNGDDKGHQTESNPNIADPDPKLEVDFNKVADSTGTIGWYELKDLLTSSFPEKLEFDKMICRMMIKTATQGSSERINFVNYYNIITGVRGQFAGFGEVDKDSSGLLDPFEVKDAFAGGKDLSFTDVENLIKTVGQEGKMSLYGFMLANMLLHTLSNTQQGIDEDNNPAVLKWMQEQIDFLKSGKPFKEMQ